jgi:hypothetical protein
LFFKGSMELHVAEIIIILLDVVKQHVRFITYLQAWYDSVNSSIGSTKSKPYGKFIVIN